MYNVDLELSAGMWNVAVNVPKTCMSLSVTVCILWCLQNCSHSSVLCYSFTPLLCLWTINNCSHRLVLNKSVRCYSNRQVEMNGQRSIAFNDLLSYALRYLLVHCVNTDNRTLFSRIPFNSIALTLISLFKLPLFCLTSSLGLSLLSLYF